MKTLKEVVDLAEYKYLTKLMKETSNHSIAASVAGTSRTQLFRLLDKHNIPRSPHATLRSD